MTKEDVKLMMAVGLNGAAAVAWITQGFVLWFALG
jgi:hypothetical protein